MDFLFVELLFWGKAEGYDAFRPRQPRRCRGSTTAARAAAVAAGPDGVRARRGLLQFPGRAPVQEQVRPAVGAALHRGRPGKWSIPILMADVAFLTSGRGGGADQRPPGPPKTKPAPSAPGGDARQVGQVDQHQKHDHEGGQHKRP